MLVRLVRVCRMGEKRVGKRCHVSEVERVCKGKWWFL
jgi:hypothetical protein